jgi:hypothetical protein
MPAKPRCWERWGRVDAERAEFGDAAYWRLSLLEDPEIC